MGMTISCQSHFCFFIPSLQSMTPLSSPLIHSSAWFLPIIPSSLLPSRSSNDFLMSIFNGLGGPCSTRQPFREELVRCWTTSSPLLEEVCVQTGNQEEALGSLLGNQEVTILQIERVARSDPHMPASIPTNLLVLVTVKEEKAPPFLAGATPSHRGPEGFTSSSISKRPSDFSLPFDLALLIS